MKLSKRGYQWLKEIAKEVTEDELRALCREALAMARKRKASVVGKKALELAWGNLNGGE